MYKRQYYNKATQKGLEAHYTKIAEAAKIPAILYNVPSRTGCAIAPETVARLVKNVEYIVGIKEASGDIGNVAKIMHLCDGNIDQMCIRDRLGCWLRSSHTFKECVIAH